MEPKIQNIPIRTPAGKSIRDAFVGQRPLFPSCDYSQTELRILAQLSDKSITLYAGPECSYGKQVEQWLREADIDYTPIPVSGIMPELTQGPRRLQTMDEIKEFIDSCYPTT